MSLRGDLMTANLSRSAWLFDLLQFGSFKGLTRKHRPSRGHSWRAIQDTHHTRGKPASRLMLNGRLDSKSSHTTRVGQDVPICKIRQIHKIANNTMTGSWDRMRGFDSLWKHWRHRLDRPPARVRLPHQSQYNTGCSVGRNWTLLFVTECRL